MSFCPTEGRTVPKLSRKLPAYRRHSDRDKAFVVISGRRVYLPGKFNSDELRAEYKRLCAEWITAERPATPAPQVDAITVSELIVRFWRYAERHDTKNGEQTDELDCLRLAFRHLRELYGRTPCC